MLLLNPARFGGPAFDPESVGDLQVWYDLSDASSLTVVSGAITAMDNKAAADTMNDAVGDDQGTASAGLLKEVARINSLNTGFADDVPKRAQVTRDNSQAFTRPGSGGFRVYFVMETAVSETIVSVPWTNGIRTNEGGGMNFTINFPAVGDARWTIEDVLTSGHGIGQAVVLAVNNSVTDGNPHIIMLGRSVGTGAGGVDQLVGSIDGVVPTGLPLDLASGFGSVDNTGAVNAITGWMIMGAFGAVPSSPSTHTRASFGELLMYHTDLTSGDETEVVDYLTDKWGI